MQQKSEQQKLCNKTLRNTICATECKQQKSEQHVSAKRLRWNKNQYIKNQRNKNWWGHSDIW